MWEDENKKKDPTQDFVPPDSPSDLKRKEAIKGYYQDAWEKKQKGLDDNLKSAKSDQEVGQYADVAGNLFTNYANSQKTAVPLANRLQDLGKRHDTIEPDQQKWNSVAPMFDKKVADARTAKDDSYKGMQRDIELQSIDTELNDKDVSRARTDQQYDSSSEVSKMAQILAKSSLASKAKEAELAGDKDAAAKLRTMDTSKMSAQEAKSFADSLKGTDYKDVISANIARDNLASQNANQAASRDLTASGQAEAARHNQATEDNTAELNAVKAASATAKLPSVEQQKANNNSAMGLKGVRDMRKALEDGDNTFSLFGDNNFTEAQRRSSEAFGRLQSGGAINKDEEARFIAMGPKPTDSKEMQMQKLANQEAEYMARLKEAGIDAEKYIQERTPQAAPSVGDAIAAERARRAAMKKQP